ncbi:DUF5996 family protein [Saccharopolyspora phatthalungensis]|uniref:Ava_C0101 and related proteins n=1 Tax=Saccharopolyspora phatthalungensis TaxID=664693 RepID=A0A840QFU8_9PSEU|nr:DUF5996 family protein [Saccharopolyspora phatthalungensis]MBB5159316.1 hypothetical protein [Saccharopolyspora phatthalungensis]
MTSTQNVRSGRAETWPSLPVDEWAATRDTLHMWTQIVGKIRLALAPMVNHWWQVPLYVSPRGLTTSAIPYRANLFDMEFDFIEHQLRIRSSGGDQRQVALEPKSVASFYRETTTALAELEIEVPIWPDPVEVQRAIPFADDTKHASYNPEHARRFWAQLTAAHQVISQFRSRFIGKTSPVHFFWGSMDLACTRFSGRPAPRHPGGALNLGNWVMVEAYSHELSSCGFWPGGSQEGTFYSYAYPEPEGYAEHPVKPQAAAYSTEFGEFLLPYEAVRTAADPEQSLLNFLQTTYEAAADNANWYRDALEDRPERRAAPR